MKTNGFRLRVFDAHLTYPAGQEVHTAASGRIASLAEVFLKIEDRETGLVGFGEVRANIEFISHTPEQAVIPGVVSLGKRLADAGDLNQLLEQFEERRDEVPNICQAVFENALCDLRAKMDGVSAAEHLGGVWQSSVNCNQCVFWGTDQDMHRNLESYVAEGFHDIKLRVGIGTIDDDERRLRWMRDTYRGQISLAVDANGVWQREQALRNIEILEHVGIDYCEQPVPEGDWESLEWLAERTDVDLVLDEGLQHDSDVERLCANKGRISAHLKIAKAGGVYRVVNIGRQLDQHGVSYVMGQMNEGALATAVAVQAGMVLKPRVGELYGALNIDNDPGTGVTYGAGTVSTRQQAGVGVSIDEDQLSLRWESDES